jgi:hypothetical protein
MAMKQWFGVGLCLTIMGCGAKAPAGSGGFQLDPSAGACPAGYAVSNSDYTSTNISALSPLGALLSQSVISSGSAPPGLTTALSGDVVFPSAAPASGKMVLIDRFPNSVLTWVEPTTGAVIRQLAVGTGFAANPQDYLELSTNKAYVSRYESNPTPGQTAFDAGGDLLIVDPERTAITGRVELATAADGAFLPRADRLLLVGSEVWVSLQRFDADFKTAGDARLVGVDPTSDAVSWTLDLPGVANCGGVARSPSGKVAALACSGVASDLDTAQNPAPTLRSDIVLLDATRAPPVVLKQFAAAATLGAPIGSTLAFASETLLVSVALGDSTASRTDLAFTIDTSLGTPQRLLDAGAAFAFGDVRCAPGCSDLCFLADAQANALHVWKAAGATLTQEPSVVTDPSIGLPPRAIGAL